MRVNAGVQLNSTDVLDALTDLFILRGPPEYIRSDNGPEFIAQTERDWIAAVGAKTAYIEPGSPWENGCCESFNARVRPSRQIYKAIRLPGNGRVARWRTVLHLKRGLNPDRTLAHPLQHRQAAQRIGLSPVCTRKHRHNGSGRRCTNNHTGPPDGRTPR